jgi:rhamnogalacturonan endolyase
MKLIFRTWVGAVSLAVAAGCGSTSDDSSGGGDGTGSGSSSSSSGGSTSSSSSSSANDSGAASSSGGSSGAGSSSGSSSGGVGSSGSGSSSGARDAGSGASSSSSSGAKSDAGSDATTGHPDAGADTGTAAHDASVVDASPPPDNCPTTSTTGTFSAVDDGTHITVTTGAGLVYAVTDDNASIDSMVWNGNQLNDATKQSQIASGVAGTATLQMLSGGTIALVTVDCGTLIQYIASRQRENTIYMGTFITAEPSVGELRWINRLKGNVLTGVPPQSNNTGSTGNVESTDVFGYADGHTTSKYYGNQQAKDLGIRGVTGTGVGVFMSYGIRESSSGGPFFRDIQNQSSTAADSELYNYMNSGHNQTQAVRTGVLYGPYADSFTTGCTPAIPDFSWVSILNMQGYVAAAGRGSVVGDAIAGMDGVHTYMVGFDNPTAQYWTAVDPSTGAFDSSGMKPGTYDVSVYKGELAVFTGTANVTAGAMTSMGTIAIDADPSTTKTIWRIGDWDGTPLEFNNGANLANMHPSDVRMNNWNMGTFTVGTSPTGAFPAVQFRGDNTPTTIQFSLTAAQVTAHTVKIGITSAYAGGRPVISIGSFTSAAPAASTQPDSRSVTIGTYRGNNTTYTYNVPANAFVAGTNTMTVTVASGSADLGTWLSANWGYDAVELE